MTNKMPWKDSPQYKRILEILEDYWLSQPDELAVVVSLDFLHADGQRQSKELVWINPNYQYVGPERIGLNLVSVADIKLPPEGYKTDTIAHINHHEYRKKGLNNYAETE